MLIFFESFHSSILHAGTVPCNQTSPPFSSTGLLERLRPLTETSMSTTIRATSNETSAFSGLTPKRTRTLSFHSRGASCASTPSTLAQVAKRHRSHTGLRSIFGCGKDPHLYSSGDYHPPKKARDDEKSSVYNAAKVPQLPISQAIQSHNTLGIPPSISSRSLPPVITFDEPVEGTVRLIGPSTVELSSRSLYPPSENTRLSSRDIIPVSTVFGLSLLSLQTAR